MTCQDDLSKKYHIRELDTIIDNCVKLIEDKKAERNIDKLNIEIDAFGKSYISAKEILLLCSSGYPDGALSIARNIYEQFMIVSYLEQKSTQPNFNCLIQKYFDDYEMKRLKMLAYESKIAEENEESYKWYEQDISAIKNKYTTNKSNGYWWADDGIDSFTRLCDYVIGNETNMKSLIHQMHLLYKVACTTIHASCLGNTFRLGSKFDGVDLGPWGEGQEYALFLTTTSLIYIIGIVFYQLGIKDDIIKELNKLAIKYQSMINNKNCE